VTGFEPLDILQGTYLCVKQLEEGRHEVENQYSRSVLKEGNLEALKVIKEVFHVVNKKWRGIGEIPKSGWALNDKYRSFDAEERFGVAHMTAEESTECISGQILLGVKKPAQCPAFGTRCTPEHPLGAPMVSTEGACSAYYRYRRAETVTPS
jgi:hydrogenase expression/formation protein HypD